MFECAMPFSHLIVFIKTPENASEIFCFCVNSKEKNKTLLPPLEPVYDIYRIDHHIDHRVDEANLSNAIWVDGKKCALGSIGVCN